MTLNGLQLGAVFTFGMIGVLAAAAILGGLIVLALKKISRYRAKHATPGVEAGRARRSSPRDLQAGIPLQDLSNTEPPRSQFPDRPPPVHHPHARYQSDGFVLVGGHLEGTSESPTSPGSRSRGSDGLSGLNHIRPNVRDARWGEENFQQHLREHGMGG